MLRYMLKSSRDHARTPMQWNKGKNAGFSNQEVGYDTSILNDEKILIKNYEKHQKGTLKPYESIVLSRKKYQLFLYFLISP